jgi:hypothetical protein
MKCAMVIFGSGAESEEMSEAERDFDALVRWWADQKASGKIVASARLAPGQVATSVSWRGKEPLVTDGPYLEAKESVAGFAILEVESYAEAVEIAASWPFDARHGFRIEVHRVVQP